MHSCRCEKEDFVVETQTCKLCVAYHVIRAVCLLLRFPICFLLTP